MNEPPVAVFNTIRMVLKRHWVNMRHKLLQGQIHIVLIHSHETMVVVHMKHWTVSHSLKHTESEKDYIFHTHSSKYQSENEDGLTPAPRNSLAEKAMSCMTLSGFVKGSR